MRYCRQHEEHIRADLCAASLAGHDYVKFWRNVNKLSNTNVTKYANTINGATGEANIADMWFDHYSHLYNSIPHSDSAKNIFLNRLAHAKTNDSDLFCVRDVINAINDQKRGKATGPDGVVMEAIINGGLRLAVHICLLFNMFIKLQYLPESFMQSVLVPLVKCKSSDLSDVNNYRAIALSTVMSKIFETVLAIVFLSNVADTDYQFGFKSGLSTSLCTQVFKDTVDYYTNRGSHVFACFIDFSKAFDRVNYWKLFNKLLDDQIDPNVIGILAFWYSQQQVCVKWQNTMTASFRVTNGTRQGGVLSPTLFNRYINDLITVIVSSHIGCHVGSKCVNILAYADDMVLLTPAWCAMQQLLDIIVEQISYIDMTCNIKKTVCMVFSPKVRRYIISDAFPLLTIGDEYVQYTKSFRYLGHVIKSDLCDDDDILREVRNMFYRTNILLRKFNKCTISVKKTLFRTYCLCLYDIALWRSYGNTMINKLKSCYNKCIKVFFGYKRCYSVTNMLCELGLPSFDTVMMNSNTSFNLSWVNCRNSIVEYLNYVI